MMSDDDECGKKLYSWGWALAVVLPHSHTHLRKIRNICIWCFISKIMYMIVFWLILAATRDLAPTVISRGFFRILLASVSICFGKVAEKRSV